MWNDHSEINGLCNIIVEANMFCIFADERASPEHDELIVAASSSCARVLSE